MTVADLAAANLLSPVILCFALGAVANLLRSDLKLPEPVFTALSIYLMLAIGLKGGIQLANRPLAELAVPLTAALALGCLIPMWSYGLLRRFAGLSVVDAAALAAHYGSVSAVTFAAVVALLDQQNVFYEGYMPAMLAIMEVPAIIVAIGLARIAAIAHQPLSVGQSGAAVLMRSGSPAASPLSGILTEILSSKSVVLLIGGMLIGAVSGAEGIAKVKPLFVDLFQGVLCLFLLELGRIAASRVDEFRQVGLRLAAFALVMPVLHAALGIGAAHMIGMSEGGAIILGTLAASASYIAAPAAVRLALPEANPGYYLTCSLAITFPFNILVGLPLYAAMTAWLYG